ncbi:MAG: transposase, partial [Gemmatimonadota bacterium]
GGIFSCKGRGACPSCGARRMVEVAAHLSDAVLPPVPLRQWVLSLPKRLRPYLHHDPQLAGAILRVLLRAIQTRLRRTSPGAAPDARLGAISFLHRFGSALNPHFHFHVVVLDGLFSQEPDGTVRFHEATHLTGDDAHHLQSLLQRRILRLFQRRGLLDPATVDNMLTWQGSGSFSLDASVRIHGTDRGGRERLLRYCARPPLALERMSLEHSPGGRMTGGGPEEGNAGPEEAGPGETGPIRRVLYLPARPLPDGRSVLALSPLEFLAALARLIPPPRVHRHRYHGVLAPNARLRASVVGLAREHTVALEDPAATAGCGVSVEVAGMDAATAIRGVDGAFSAPDAPPAETAPLDPARRAARSRWARLIARIYEVSPLTCPNCGAEMRILAFLTDPAVVV